MLANGIYIKINQILLKYDEMNEVHMKSLEKLLHNASEFLCDVTEISSKWVQDLQVEKSREIVNYHPLSGGHMLRPLLVYLTACASKRNLHEETRKQLVYFAAAVELMHNASLLHDDLLDHEEIRRGKPCVSQAYGYKNALLGGNIYYIKAIELSNHYLESSQTADLLKAAIAMCEGEILQAQYEMEEIPVDVYEKIIRYKTGSLTALACRQAAAILQEEANTVNNFGKLGEELGVMYQLRDDRKDRDVILDTHFVYTASFDLCHIRILSILEQMSITQNIEQFEELVAYFS